MTESQEISQLAAEKIYQEWRLLKTPLEKHHYLYRLHDINPSLFCQLVQSHLMEMLPIIYTPTVGDAIEHYDPKVYRPAGIFLSYPEKNKMDDTLSRWPHQKVDLIIVTDGEAILGIGDQGVGGINICVGKGMVYSLCANIHPDRILPVYLDVGTNNQKLLQDKNYSGWQHERIDGKDYDDFIQLFIDAIKKKFPTALLHWEDFGNTHARNNLLRYRHRLPSFNDDMQGTGVVVLASILSALKKINQPLVNQKIVIFGAGTAGTGIADQIAQAMKKEGLVNPESSLWLIGRHGLLTDQSPHLNDAQRVYAKKSLPLNLKEAIQQIKPTLLIGCSTVAGAFDQEIIQMMAKFNKHPIIMPLSNPTRKAEATAQAIIEGTKGRALIATGSPFDDVNYEGKNYPITQCNNAYVFPGIGLGTMNAQAKIITDEMLINASYALADFKHDQTNLLLPPLTQLSNVTKHIAKTISEAVEKHIGSVTE